MCVCVCEGDGGLLGLTVKCDGTLNQPFSG